MLEHVPSLFSYSLLLKLTIAVWLSLAVRIAVKREKGPHWILALLCAVASGVSAAFGTSSVAPGCSAVIAIAIAVVCFVSVPRRSSVLLIVAAAVGLALSVGAFYRSVAPGHSVAAWFLLAGNCVATALAMIFALEMTGVLTPVEMRDEQPARSMIKWLSIISFGALLATTLALSSVFFGQGPVSSIDAGRMRDEFQVIAWVFHEFEKMI